MAQRSATARVRLEATGREKITRALRGVASDARRASDETKRANAGTASAAEQSGRRIAAAGKRAARATSLDLGRAEKERQAALRKTANEAESSARTQVAAIRRVLRETRRAAQEQQPVTRRTRQAGGGSRGGRGAAAALGGFVAGVGASARDRLQGFASSLGVPTPQDAVARAIGVDQSLIRLRHEAGVSSARMGDVRASVVATSRDTNLPAEDLVDALRVAHEAFNQFDFVANNLQAFGRAANATGGDVGDLVRAMGEMQRQFGVTEQDVRAMLGVLVESSERGSIGAGDIAHTFAPILGQAARTTGRRGVAGASEALGLFQAVAAGGESRDRAGETTRGLLASVPRLARAGIRLRERDGTMRPLADIFRDAEQSSNRRLRTESGRRRLLGEVGGRGLGILFTEMRASRGRGEESLLTRARDVSAAAGQRRIDEANRELTQSDSGKALAVGTNAMANYLENSGELVRTVTALTGPLADLQSRFPLVSQALGVLVDGATAAGISLAAFKFLVPGAGAGAGTGVAGTVATAAGGGVLAPVAATVGAGAAVLGGAYLAAKHGTRAVREANLSGYQTATPIATAEQQRALREGRAAALASSTMRGSHAVAPRTERLPPLDATAAARLLGDHIRAAIRETPVRVETMGSPGDGPPPGGRRGVDPWPGGRRGGHGMRPR